MAWLDPKFDLKRLISPSISRRSSLTPFGVGSHFSDVSSIERSYLTRGMDDFPACVIAMTAYIQGWLGPPFY